MGQMFDFLNCFIHNPQLVQLISDREDALIEGIEITFDEKAKTPYMLNGSLNLVTGETDGPFLIFGAKEVAIQFNEKMLTENES